MDIHYTAVQKIICKIDFSKAVRKYYFCETVNSNADVGFDNYTKSHLQMF